MQNSKIKKYIQSLRALSLSTDDYLFVWDIKNNTNWFFGDIDKDFDIREPGVEWNKTEQMLEIVHPKDRGALKRSLDKVKNGLIKEHNMTYRWVSRDGESIWINCRGSVIDDEDGAPMVLLGRVSRAPYENLVSKVSGLFNKSKLLQDFNEKKLLNAGGTMLLVTIDRLMKMYGDKGRSYAENLVEKFAKILEEHAGKFGLLYQVEDDTFAVCLKDGTEDDSRKIYDALVAAIGGEYNITGLSLPYGKKYFVDVNIMYRTAIMALVDRKKCGRAKLNYYTPRDLVEQTKSTVLSNEIEKSIKNGFDGFYVCYQPLIRGNDYSLHGVEALMRFRSARGEFLPLEFIPLLEQSGAIKAAGLWILKEALAQVKEWRKQISDLHLNVNFSLEQFRDPDVIESVISIFRESGLPRGSLTIELTETMKLANVEQISMIATAWKEAGIEISIDDFGSGYSNLSLLNKIKSDEIKIEKMFVTNVKQGSYSYLLINSVIAFARKNGIRVCCEGVETVSDVEMLTELEPEILQGYAFDRPCSVSDFEHKYIDSTSAEYGERIRFVRELTEKRRERLMRFNPSDILRNINVGLSVMKFDRNTARHEVHPDEIMSNLFGMSADMSPSDCYDFLFGRIKQGYKDFVEESVERLIESETTVQFAYPWIHPVLGELLLSCSGVKDGEKDGVVTVKGLHRIISGIEKRAYDENVRSLRYSMQNKYIDIILQNAIAYMEINLTDNRLIGRLTDMADKQPDSSKDQSLFIGKDERVNYEAFEKWWADRYLLSSKQEFNDICNCEYLISCYLKGQTTVEFFCRGEDRNGIPYDCKKTYHITRDEIMGDVTALCVMYDISDLAKEKIEVEHKNSIIRAICDEFKSISYVNLDADLVEFYREDESLPPWRDGEDRYSVLCREFVSNFVVAQDREAYLDALSIDNIKREFATKAEFRFEYSRIMRDRTVRRHVVKVMHYDNGLGQSRYAIVGVKDVEDERRREKVYMEALDKVYTDYLTGLLNQQGLSERSRELLGGGKDAAVMFMDLDNFKYINDKYGHTKGDEVLYRVGAILKEETNNGDLIGRYGGDEYVAVIGSVSAPHAVIAIAERILSRIAGLGAEMGLSKNISVSVGIAFSAQNGHSYRILKEIADDRLYLAKKRGKNMIVTSS